MEGFGSVLEGLGKVVDWGVREVRVYFFEGGGGFRSASISARKEASSWSAFSSRVRDLGGEEEV